ncbi:MAG: Uma2 family endonuclease [Acidobacteriota bacterium]|nr:Uma2 family endonuclease [Acidobacteriota bacterium]
MAAVLTPPEIAETRVSVPNVSWDTYERLLADLSDCSAPRLTYDRGELEIKSPTPKHEKVNRAIEILVSTLASEMQIEVASLGSTTFKREDIDRGFEPDSCFYITNEMRIRGKDQLDLKVDPPPDVVFEVDITKSSINKQSLWAKFDVPEVWRYDGNTVRIFTLVEGAYVASLQSRALPALSSEVLTGFVTDCLTITRVQWMKKLTEWARQQKAAKLQ